MAAIVFDEETMGTGVQTIDDQHKQLIEMINRLSEATSSGRGKHEVARMMNFLAYYAVEHFSHEECIMSEMKCPVAEMNRAAHDAFLRDFTELKSRLDSQGPTLEVVMELQRRVVDWLTDHIKGCDAQLRCAVTR